MKWKRGNSEEHSNGILYTWRLMDLTEKRDSNWSSFQTENFLWLELPGFGDYEFQVKAMNSRFEIEPEPIRYRFSFKSESKEDVTEVSPENWVTPRFGGDPDAAPSMVKRAEEPGLFGCFLRGSLKGLGLGLFLWAIGMGMTIFALRRSVLS